MKTMNLKDLIAQADQLLLDAKHEIERAEEDVVTHQICQHARTSIANYLTYFLLKNGVAIENPVSMSSLLLQCRDLDDRFAYLDFSNIACRFEVHDQNYCLEYDTVKGCLFAAEKTRDIVTTEAPNY